MKTAAECLSVPTFSLNSQTHTGHLLFGREWQLVLSLYGRMLFIKPAFITPSGQSFTGLIMVALWNRADHYIFILWFLLFFFLLFFLA